MIATLPAHVLSAVVSAVVAAPTSPTSPAVVSGGPYCGVYCVYAAARACGRPAEFEDLLDQRYVGSYKGSTISELQAAAARLGLNGTAMTGLTPAALRDCPHPVILHVRRPGYKMPYAHWVLFAGVEDGRARIVDPPAGVELVPFAELAAQWDGVGLVVSDAPPDARSLQLAAWVESATIVAVVGLALVALRLGTAGRRRFRPVVAGVAVVGAGGAVGLAWHAIAGDGLYSDRDAVSLVAGQYFQPAIPEISLAEARSLVGRPGVAVVDARLPPDYSAGHIPGALSLPIVSGLRERRLVSQAVPHGSRVIVYCQSSGCVWADSIAADLYHRGHVDVCIFRDGWVAWAEHEK